MMVAKMGADMTNRSGLLSLSLTTNHGPGAHTKQCSPPLPIALDLIGPHAACLAGSRDIFSKLLLESKLQGLCGMLAQKWRGLYSHFLLSPRLERVLLSSCLERVSTSKARLALVSTGWGPKKGLPAKFLIVF